MTSVLDFARTYSRGGFSTIPVRADGSKAPAVESWKQFQSRLPGDEEVGRLFRRNVGIAILGGKVSGNLEVMDFDEVGLFEEFSNEVRKHDASLLNKLPIVSTPRGGFHVYYRCKSVDSNQKLAMRPTENNGKQRPEVRIETRGEGGYVLAPGSPAECHSTKKLYEHQAGPSIEDTPTITRDEREILLSVARSFHTWSDEPRSSTLPPSNAHDRSRDGLSPGDDFGQQTSWERILEPHGWTSVGQRGELTLWRRPGKAIGISATTGLASKVGNELLCVFSSNAHPFEVNGTHATFTKFAAYAMLNHNNDYQEAARELGGQGYGEQSRSGTDDRAVEQESRRIDYGFQPLSLLADHDFQIEYIIEDVLAANHVGGIVGASKTLKTSIAADLAFAVATSGHFLGYFPVQQAQRVAFMSGESGMPTLIETFNRISAAAGKDIRDVSNLLITDRLTQLGHAGHMYALRTFLEENEVGVFMLDPLYLAADTGGKEGSLFAMGALLRSITDVATETGVTLVILHHMTQASAKVDKTPELFDSAWAGTQQYFRQWIAINRRTQYDTEQPGHHELRLVTGGSMGHSTGVAVDIDEGSRRDPGGRRWDVVVRSLSEVEHEQTQQVTATKRAQRDGEREARAKGDRELAVRKLEAVYPEGLTKNALRDRCSFSGERMGRVIESLIEREAIEECNVTISSRKRAIPGYRLRKDANCKDSLV